IMDGIRAERHRLEAVKEKADKIIDTSTLSVRELRNTIVDAFVRGPDAVTLTVTVLSFGYKYGIPLDADLVFDVRFLPNPYYVEAFRALPGNSPEVRAFVLGFEQTVEFQRRLHELLAYLLPQFTAEGKSHFTVAVGCTGGKHRSVVIGDDLARFLSEKGYAVRVKHRDVG